jgi:DNA-binding transcriptional LysR family regulator
MAITLASLRVFVEVAESGNIRDAAERLGRTSSAVSMSLKQLEADFGGALFEGDRKTRLSPLGRYALSISKSEVMGFDRAVSAIRAYARTEAGRLELACVPSVASSLMPEVLQRLGRSHGSLEIDLRDADSETVAREVADEQVELGIASAPTRPMPVAYRPLFRDPFVLVCPAEHPLARAGQALAWEALKPLPLIANGSAARIEHPVHRALTAGSSLMVRNVLSLLALVRAGTGVTLLPRLSVPEGMAGIASVPLADAGCTREVGLLSRQGESPSPPAAVFLEHLRAVLEARSESETAPLQLSDPAGLPA